MQENVISVRRIGPEDHEWIIQLLRREWGSTRVVSRGQLHEGEKLPGWVALSGSEKRGLLTYRLQGDELEIVTLNSIFSGTGIGTALIRRVQEWAVEQNIRRIWLITTNDNVEALRFFQRRGFRLRAVYPDALRQSRSLKDVIPQVGLHGIPLRDEVELEWLTETASGG